MREFLYDTSLRLFRERGYAETTLRQIAKTAKVSPALLYRYFPAKNAVVLELYGRLSETFAETARNLDTGTWADRFLAALDLSLASLSPYREVMKSLLPTLLAPGASGIFSAETAFSRERVSAVFFAAVAGAKNSPARQKDRTALAHTLYLVHLGVILFWCMDSSIDQTVTAKLRALLGQAVRPVALALRLPGVFRWVHAIDGIYADFLKG